MVSDIESLRGGSGASLPKSKSGVGAANATSKKLLIFPLHPRIVSAAAFCMAAISTAALLELALSFVAEEIDEMLSRTADLSSRGASLFL